MDTVNSAFEKFIKVSRVFEPPETHVEISFLRYIVNVVSTFIDPNVSYLYKVNSRDELEYVPSKKHHSDILKFNGRTKKEVSNSKRLAKIYIRYKGDIVYILVVDYSVKRLEVFCNDVNNVQLFAKLLGKYLSNMYNSVVPLITKGYIGNKFSKAKLGDNLTERNLAYDIINTLKKVVKTECIALWKSDLNSRNLQLMAVKTPENIFEDKIIKLSIKDYISITNGVYILSENKLICGEDNTVKKSNIINKIVNKSFSSTVRSCIVMCAESGVVDSVQKENKVKTVVVLSSGNFTLSSRTLKILKGFNSEIVQNFGFVDNFINAFRKINQEQDVLNKVINEEMLWTYIARLCNSYLSNNNEKYLDINVIKLDSPNELLWTKNNIIKKIVCNNPTEWHTNLEVDNKLLVYQSINNINNKNIHEYINQVSSINVQKISSIIVILLEVNQEKYGIYIYYDEKFTIKYYSKLLIKSLIPSLENVFRVIFEDYKISKEKILNFSHITAFDSDYCYTQFFTNQVRYVKKLYNFDSVLILGHDRFTKTLFLENGSAYNSELVQADTVLEVKNNTFASKIVNSKKFISAKKVKNFLVFESIKVPYLGWLGSINYVYGAYCAGDYVESVLLFGRKRKLTNNQKSQLENFVKLVNAEKENITIVKQLTVNNYLNEMISTSLFAMSDVSYVFKEVCWYLKKIFLADSCTLRLYDKSNHLIRVAYSGSKGSDKMLPCDGKSVQSFVYKSDSFDIVHIPVVGDKAILSNYPGLQYKVSRAQTKSELCFKIKHNSAVKGTINLESSKFNNFKYSQIYATDIISKIGKLVVKFEEHIVLRSSQSLRPMANILVGTSHKFKNFLVEFMDVVGSNEVNLSYADYKTYLKDILLSKLEKIYSDVEKRKKALSHGGKAQTNLCKLLQCISYNIEHEYSHKKISCICDIRITKEFSLNETKAAIFEIVIEELLYNAVSVVQRDEYLDNRRIEIVMSDDTSDLYIDILDTGGGFKSDQRDIFYNPYTDKEFGTGVGLQIASTLLSSLGWGHELKSFGGHYYPSVRIPKEFVKEGATDV